MLSEASASNGDWIEIRNDGSDPINLAGHKLADDFEDDEPWAFGEVSLQAGERLVVHATGNSQSTTSPTGPSRCWRRTSFVIP